MKIGTVGALAAAAMTISIADEAAAQLPPECKANPMGSMAIFGFMMINPACDIVSPETRASRADGLRSLREAHQACYDAMEKSAELRAAFSERAKEATADEAKRENTKKACEEFYRKLPELLQQLKAAAK